MPSAIYGDWSKDIDNVPIGLIEGAFENINVYLFSDKQLKSSKRAYYAMISQLDYSLGLLFGCLRENNLINDENYVDIKEELWGLLIENTKKYTPYLLKNNDFIISEPPKSIKDIKNRWFCFHFKDYSVDTFY